MKIISNNECYIQGYDLEHLIYDDTQFPVSMYMDISKKRHQRDLSKYYKIEDKSQIEYLMNNGIVADYNELASYSETGLKKLIDFFKRELYYETTKSDEFNSDTVSYLIETFRKRRQLEYMISQVREMLKLKQHTSDIVYPDVPNPVETPISNGTLKACRSIVPGNVLIYNADNSGLTGDIDYDFCKIAFDMLKLDYKENIDEDIKVKFSKFRDDMKYYIMGYKTKEIINKPTLRKK